MVTRNKGDGYFEITSVHREDIQSVVPPAVWETVKDKITDDHMERIADKMADAYCDNGFWSDLETVVWDRVLNEIIGDVLRSDDDGC